MPPKDRKGTVLPDDEIIALYFARDESAVEATDAKYGRYLLSVARNILSDLAECAECIDDTYLGAWNAIPPARPLCFKAFLVTILRRGAVKRLCSSKRKSAVPTELLLSFEELEIADIGDNTDASFDALRLGEIISAFVRSLPERRRYIFMSRYYEAERIDVIARELSLSRSMVNKELSAIRIALKKKLESEGYSV